MIHKSFRLHRKHKHKYPVTPGELPGIEHIADVSVPPAAHSVVISYTDYSDTNVVTGDVTHLDEFLAKPIPDWVTTRWINVTRAHPFVINALRKQFEFHTLNAEDVLHVPQRPRVEFFDDHLFVVVRMLQLVSELSQEQQEALEKAPDGRQQDSTHDTTEHTLDIEQISLFIYGKVLITFQQKPGDVWQPIRNRLQKDNSRLRKNGTGYLSYALLDAIVDHCFPVLEHYGDALEELELMVLEKPSTVVLHRIHTIKRELALLRRIVWPMREVVDQLYREEGGKIGETTKPYLRDVYEHTIQIVEIIESYRETTNNLTDLYMSSMSNRMNEIMKVLTIMASVFIPLTFIAGVYGMNFQYMPELSWHWAYPITWASFIVLTIGMLFLFWRKGWIGKG